MCLTFDHTSSSLRRVEWCGELGSNGLSAHDPQPTARDDVSGVKGLDLPPIGLKILMGVQETIIYRLMMRNPSYNAYFSFFIFWATFGGKIGVAITSAPNGVGPPNPIKKLAHWVDLLGQPLS